MSFGFGIGDFLAVAEASKKLWDQFEKSPSYFRDARAELANISSFIEEEEARRMGDISDTVEKQRVQDLFQICKDLVKEANTSLDKFEDIKPMDKSPGSRARFGRFIDRFKYDENDIIRARERIHQALSRLAARFQTLDSKLLQHVSSVVERTAVDVGDAKAGVERTEISVGDLKAGVELLHTRGNVQDQTLEHQKILDWISPSRIDYADRQKVLRTQRQTGTGQWFLESDAFKDWTSGDHATLLCSGVPGVGKTMLTSLVVNNLMEEYQNDTQVGVAYIYCQFSRHKEQTPERLMLSILRQLLERQNIMPDEVRSLYQSRKGENDLNADEISDLLDSVLRSFNKSILVFDALDELDSAVCREVVSQVFDFQQKFNVNMYATSRYTQEIANETSNAVQIDIWAREEDLRRSLDKTIRNGFLLRKRPDLLDQAFVTTLRLAKGVFLLAVLYAKHLAGLQLMGDLLEALDSLEPVSDPYEDLYTDTMQRLQEGRAGKTNLAMTTICWLFFAKSPLRLRELLHALALSGSKPQFEKNIPAVSDVLNVCAGLVVIDEANDTVDFFHKTFDDYLMKNHSSWFPRGNEIIGTACVRYLSIDAFTDGPCAIPDTKAVGFGYEAEDRSFAPIRERWDQFPFYEYASVYWYEHVHGTDLEHSDIVAELLADDKKLNASMQSASLLRPRTTGTHFATRFSLDNALKRHLEIRRPQPNVKDNMGRTPLSYAAAANNLVAASHLINAGADPNVQDDRTVDWTRSGQADSDEVDPCNPLSHAAASGRSQMTDFLVRMGASVNHRDSHGRSALWYASQYGEFEVVSVLLGHGANANQSDYGHTTPLLLATRARFGQIISLLVEKGADVNALPYSGDSFGDENRRVVHWQLMQALRLSRQEAAEGKYLDWYGANVPTSRQENIVRLLSSVAESTDSVLLAGLSPLSYAALKGWTDIVQLLLDKGANPNNRTIGSRSALSCAVESGSLEIVELLLEHGADINQPNEVVEYCEPLYVALGIGSTYENDRGPDERMLELLLARGANPNQVVEWSVGMIDIWDSPLLYALQNLPLKDPLTIRVIQLLLKHGANIDILLKQACRFVITDGVRTEVRVIKENTAGDYAESFPEDVKDLLRQHGARFRSEECDQD